MKLPWLRWSEDLILLTTMVMVLIACTSTSSTVPDTPAYVLSGWIPDGHTALTIVDEATWQVHSTTVLPRSTALRVHRDPQQRLWIGFGGTLHDVDNRVRVYDALGTQIAELETCDIPVAGITFVQERALIACQASGMRGEVTVVHLETLAIEMTISIDHPNGDPLLLTASAAGDTVVVLAGQTRGPDAQKTYTLVTVLDAQNLTVLHQIGPLEGTQIERILQYDGRFYLLNYGNWSESRTEPTDVLIFDPATSGEITALELAAGPRWGAIADDILYAYHEQRQTLYDLQPTTMLSRLDLKSGEVETWPLPNGWGARDLAVMNGYIVLARPEQPGQDGEDGVYRFDPLTGEVRLLVDIVDASGFVAP